MSTVIEHQADCGWAVRRNGTILLRTASDSEHQAMGNGLVLIFGAPVDQIDWARPADIRSAWAACLAASDEDIDIIRCRAIVE